MRVIGRWVAVKMEEKKQTASGIQLLETEKVHQGTVVGVGDGIKSGVSVGNEVVFTPFSYFEHTLCGEKVYMIQDNDIQAIL